MPYEINPHLEIRFNKDRAKDLAETVIKLREQIPMYSDLNSYPDAIVPEGITEGSQLHALFLFYGCVTDSMKRADDVYLEMRKFNQKVSLTTLYRYRRPTIEKLVNDSFSNPKMGDIANTIFNNSQALHHQHNDNPVNIAGGLDLKNPTIKTIRELQKRIEEYHQYGPGKSALLTKNFTRFGMWDIPEKFIPLKIDRHLARISLGFDNLFEFYEDNQKIERKDYKEKVKWVRADKFNRKLQDLFLEITSENDISGIDLDDTLWLLGSKWCHRNSYSFCQRECSVDCVTRPLSDQPTTYFHVATDKRKGKGQQVLFKAD